MSDVVAPPIDVEVTLDRRQATRVVRAFPWVLRAVAGWLATTLLPAVVIVAVFSLETPVGGLFVGGAYAVTTGLLSVGPVLLRPWWRPWRSPHLHDVGLPCRWSFGPAGVGLATSLASGFLPWERIDDLVVRRGVLALRARATDWRAGLPVEALGPGGAAQVEAWWRAGRAGPVPGVAAADGFEGLVLETRPTPAAARAAAWADRRNPPPLLLRPVGLALVLVGLLVWSLASAEPFAGVGVAGSALILAFQALAAVLGEVAARAAVRGGAVTTWRVSADGIGVTAASGAWAVPWALVEAVFALDGTGVVVVRRFTRAGGVIPAEALGREGTEQVLGWARAAGVRVRRGGWWPRPGRR